MRRLLLVLQMEMTLVVEGLAEIPTVLVGLEEAQVFWQLEVNSLDIYVAQQITAEVPNVLLGYPWIVVGLAAVVGDLADARGYLQLLRVGAVEVLKDE